MRTSDHPEVGEVQIAASSSPLDRSVQESPDSRFEYLDLKAQFETIRTQVMHAIERVMASQHFILGAEVQRFESEIAAKLGLNHAIACASGTDALMLALMASDIGPGDEVITSPFTFVATAGAIARTGATPVFVDIDRDTFNISPAAVQAAIGPRTRAIMPVHLFGLSADMDPMIRLATKSSLILIEDAAQAIGARYRGLPVGTLGDFGCFSFFPSKNLGGAGDGGLVVTKDPAMADKLRMLRSHGSKKKYYHEILGMNSRLDALQAAILRVKLGYLDLWTSARRERAFRYEGRLESMNLSKFVKVPRVQVHDYEHVYNQFTLRCVSRDSLKTFLMDYAVPTEIYYPLPLHLQPSFSYLAYRPGQLPEAELASREVLSLPVYPELPEQRQQFVVERMAEFYSRLSKN